MADSTLNRFVSSGTTAERTAFIPDPPSPASGPDPGYTWFDTDDSTLYAWDGAAWQPATTGTGDVTASGTLTAGLVVIGDGGTAVDVLAAGTDGDVLTQAGGVATWAASSAAGKVAQVVNTQTGAVATGTTIIPHDDTIPEKTEGDEYMTLAITPTSATNKLRIDVVVNGTHSSSAWLIAALFQDTTTNALAASTAFATTATAGSPIGFTHYMTAGTTSSTTFKVRAGGQTAGTFTFNGQSGGRKFGGVMASSITITEIVP